MINRFFELEVSDIEPKPGMGLTVIWHSDRSAGTVVAVSESGKRFTFQSDTAIRVDKNGMSDSQQYIHAINQEARLQTAFKTRDGRWKVLKSNQYVLLGVRESYHDFSF